MRGYVACRANELPSGASKAVRLGGRSVALFNVDGHYYALRNTCPHQGAALCEGMVFGTVTASEPQQYDYDEDRHVVVCPWHGWEFDLRSGESLFDPEHVRVSRFDVIVEAGDIVIVA
jgi:nitrite reductase/ring-hydroxylating ferredoxin subunit